MTDSPTPATQSCHFFGRYRLRLDEKGRVTLPSAFRRSLPADAPEELALLEGPDGYVQILPLPEWEDRMRRLEATAGGTAKQRRERRRRLYGGVERAQLDEKGRLTVPQALIEAAGIGREVLAVGVDRAVELWDPDRWFTAEQQSTADLAGTEDILF